MTTATSAITRLLESVASKAEASGVFGPVMIKGGALVCVAKEAAAPASYRLAMETDTLWVALVMADRWLSESVESDLMHTGDKMEDLLEEELVEVGAPVTRLRIEHFRSEDLLFTFRSPLPASVVDPLNPGSADAAIKVLLAYEACFRNLGDMNAGVEGDE